MSRTHGPKPKHSEWLRRLNGLEWMNRVNQWINDRWPLSDYKLPVILFCYVFPAGQGAGRGRIRNRVQVPGIGNDRDRGHQVHPHPRRRGRDSAVGAPGDCPAETVFVASSKYHQVRCWARPFLLRDSLFGSFFSTNTWTARLNTRQWAPCCNKRLPFMSCLSVIRVSLSRLAVWPRRIIYTLCY